jgi:hypothetical protein
MPREVRQRSTGERGQAAPRGHFGVLGGWCSGYAVLRGDDALARELGAMRLL